MSILIKGIDMPKCSNEDIVVVIRHDKAEVWQTGYKERTVEATQIDRPHGRLIDGDVIRSRIEFLKSGLTDHEKEAVGCILDKALRVIESYAEYAPTVLEAEE